MVLSLMPLSGLTVFRLTGADRLSWLQGQVTQDVFSGQVLDSCLCKPTGQIETILKIVQEEDSTWVVCPNDGAEFFVDRFEQFVILEDVQSEQIWFDYSTLQGEQADEEIENWLNVSSRAEVIRHAGGLAFRSDRSGYGGWDLLGSMPDGMPTESSDVLELCEIESLIPRIGDEITDRVLPPELGAAFDEKHVSYTKGCYVGQEVLMRIYSRGHTNRTLVQLGSQLVMEPQEGLIDPDGVQVGRITRSIESPRYGPLSLGFVRNTHAQEGQLLMGESGTEAIIREGL